MQVVLWLAVLFPTFRTQNNITNQSSETLHPHLIEPGDTWTALSWRYGLSPADLKTAYPHVNQQRQPPIGTTLMLPISQSEQPGRLISSYTQGLLQTAVRFNISPWLLAIRNSIDNPYRPLLYRSVFIPGGDTPPKELPYNFEILELSQTVAHPGQALGFRGIIRVPEPVAVSLNELQFDAFSNQNHSLGLIGTGAFFGAGEPELSFRFATEPLWSQPWRFEDNEWDYQQITLTGTAAAIDQESINQERARLFQIWSLATPLPQWTTPFQEPVASYLEISTVFGTRRSYNGGPFRTHHEGVDFAAYGGTAVLAPAAGTVVLAENLYVRGGAVILDHGLGIYTGYYHMSSVDVEPGTLVQPGQQIGQVGTTGLSTGNHLHWDLLVADTWVDASAWLALSLAGTEYVLLGSDWFGVLLSKLPIKQFHPIFPLL